MQLPSLRQLEYVVAVAETGRFVEAARRCAVSQPALSKQVRELEVLMGVQLFERVRPRVLPTPVGREVVRRARQILLDTRELTEVVKASMPTQRGTVRLGVIPTIAPYGLPGLIAKLRARLPEVSFAIQELQTDVLLEQLRSGAIDLGLLARSFEDHGLKGLDLVSEPFVFVASRDDPLGIAEPITRQDLAGASLLLMQDGHCLRDQAIELCAAAGPPPPTSVSAVSVSTLVRMVESGLGPTLLPASALSVELRPGQGLVARSFDWPQPCRALTLQWRATSPNGVWFTEIGAILQAHYIALNDTLPEVSGAPPLVRVIAPPSADVP